MVAEVFKIPNFSEISTRIAEFKLQIAIHYTIEPIEKTTKMGFEPTCEDSNGFAVHRLNHSGILSRKAVTRDTSIGYNQKNFYLVLSGFLIVVVIMCANHLNGIRFEPGQNHLVVIFHDVISCFRGNMQ